MKKIFCTTIFCILLSNNSLAEHSGGTIYADVNGLVCDFCARAIEKVFKKQEAVESIDVNLDEKNITIHLKDGQTLEEPVVIEMIKDSGYDVRALRYE